jgi:hypothetical protein
MPQVRGLRILRKHLKTDRPWAAYALADLEPAYVDHTAWFRTDEPPATFLVYRAFQTTLIVYVGPSDCCAPLLDEVEGELGDATQVYLVARPDVWPLVTLRYRAVDERLSSGATWRGLVYYGCRALAPVPSLRRAFSIRHGGVSPRAGAALNLNRGMLLEALGLEHTRRSARSRRSTPIGFTS